MESSKNTSCVFRGCFPRSFPQERRLYFIEIKNTQKQENHENEKDAHRKMIAIRLTNSSSTSVSNPNMKKHMVGKSMNICGKSDVVGGGG